MRATRRQVAQHAGVSESTVSYVINDGPRQVSDATRQRVLDAIKELDYRPNAIAQSLRRQRTNIIGLIVPDTANPFYGEIARVIENACDDVGYSVMVCNSGHYQRRVHRYLNQLELNQVAGIVYIPSGDYDPTTETIDTLRTRQLPSIVLDYETDMLPSLFVDEVEVGHLATQHLIDLGHRRIGYVGRDVRNPSRSVRYTGYVEALEAAGIVPDDALVVWVGEHPEDGMTGASHLLSLDEPPTAIFAHNDMNALGVVRSATARGLSVPDDLSVVGCDNISYSAYFDPPLTTVGHSISELGGRAVERLVHAIETGETNDNSLREQLKSTLIVRESTVRAR